MKSTIIIVAMLLILATAILVIVFNFRDPDMTGARCTCPIPECPHVVKQTPQDGAQAEMHYLPYQQEEK